MKYRFSRKEESSSSQDDVQHCPLSPETREKIGKTVIIAALSAAGIAIGVAVCANPIGAAVAGSLLSILGLAAALFPEYFKDVGGCVYDRFERFVKVLHDLPASMRKVVATLKGACASGWSSFSTGVKNLWKWARGRWSKSISEEQAKQQLIEHFQEFSPQEYEELLMAACVAQSQLQELVNLAVETRQNLPAVAATTQGQVAALT